MEKIETNNDIIPGVIEYNIDEVNFLIITFIFFKIKYYTSLTLT